MKEKLESWYVHYTDPSKDGTKEPVTGSGQLNLAGPAGMGLSFRMVRGLMLYEGYNRYYI
jgi:hypothetical protein